MTCFANAGYSPTGSRRLRAAGQGYTFDQSNRAAGVLRRRGALAQRPVSTVPA